MAAGTGTDVFNIALPAGTPLSIGTHSIVVNFSGALSGAAPYYAASATTISLTVTPPALVVNNGGDNGAGATDCPVNPTGSGAGNCTLRDALSAATDAGGGNITFDATVFSSPTTITENAGIGTLSMGANTTITGPTTGSGSTLKNLVTVSGANQFTVFAFEPSQPTYTATIANLNIANGSDGSGLSGVPGGGVFNEGTLTLTGVDLNNNSAIIFGWGAGIVNAIGSLTVTNSAFSQNTSIYGGAIFSLFGAVTVNNSTFTNNAATDNTEARGGAIYAVQGQLTVANSTFTGNSAEGLAHGEGGAIYVDYGTAQIAGSTFAANFANGAGKNAGGGAICNYGASVSVANSTFFGNYAAGSTESRGGAIVNHDNGTLTVTRSTFTANSASEYGGGIYIDNGTLAMADTILSGNWLRTAKTPASYDDLDDQSGATVFTGGASDNGGNLVGYYNAFQLPTLPTTLPAPAPALAPLNSYGGPTQTMIPLPGSPAICAGTPAPTGGLTLAPTDQRGDPGANSTYPGYASAACVDSGAVQTNYSLAFAQQPSTAVPNVAMSPAPELELLESGAAFADNKDTIAIPLTLTMGPGTLTGGTASTSATTGIASYGTLSIDTPATDDVLTATLALNPAANPAPTLTLPSIAFNVNKVGTTTLLTVSSATITPGQNETLTAQVISATTGTPTGMVSFYDGTALLSTVTLSGGTASYSTTALAPGMTHTLTAVYSGDAYFLSSINTSSTNVTVAPLDFTMTLSGPSNLTVVPGQSISYQVQVTPDYGSYAGTVNFAISGLPPGATVTFSPSSIAANGGLQTITVTIQTAPATAMLHGEPPPSGGRRVAPFALAFLLLFGAGSLRKRGRALRGLLCVLVLISAGAAAMTLSGCGTDAGFFGQAPHDYTMTITATAGPLEHSATVTLDVQ